MTIDDPHALPLPPFLTRDTGPTGGDRLLRALSRGLEALGLLPKFHRQTVKAARAKMHPWRGPVGTLVHGAIDALPVEELEVVGPAGPRPMRRYIGGENGVLLWLHGGGYVVGDLRSHDRVCRRLAAAGGLNVLALDYRLAPEHPHPAALDDAEAALRAIVGWAAGWGLSGAPLSVGGDSAGANLTVALAQRTRDIDVHKLILAYPAADTRRAGASVAAYSDGPLLHSADVAWFEGQTAPGGGAGLVGFDLLGAEAAGATGAALSGLPPVLLLLGGRDLLRDEGIALGARVVALGGQVEGRLFPEAVHGVMQTYGVSGSGRRMIAAAARAAQRPR